VICLDFYVGLVFTNGMKEIDITQIVYGVAKKDTNKKIKESE